MDYFFPRALTSKQRKSLTRHLKSAQRFHFSSCTFFVIQNWHFFFPVWSMKIDTCFNPDWYSFLQAHLEYIFLSADFFLRLVNDVPGKLIDCTSQKDISKTSVTTATWWRWKLTLNLYEEFEMFLLSEVIIIIII